MKQRKKKKNFPARYVLFGMTVLSAAVIVSGTVGSEASSGVGAVAGAVIVPMQKGVNTIGSALYHVKETLQLKSSLIAENEELRSQLAQLQEELNQVQLDEAEYNRLKELYNLDQSYTGYEKLAANVIGKDTGNWFSVFLIDRGSNDGIETGMNVIADGGLAGVVTDVGPTYAKVRAIIDDNSNVSGKNLSTEDLCNVSGSLQSMNESSTIDFTGMRDDDDTVQAGDQIVVSNVSDVFLEGIPIGYITDVTLDSNNLTKSGHIATIVDFEHLDDVLVILSTKDVTMDTADFTAEDDSADTTTEE